MNSPSSYKISTILNITIERLIYQVFIIIIIIFFFLTVVHPVHGARVLSVHLVLLRSVLYICTSLSSKLYPVSQCQTTRFT